MNGLTMQEIDAIASIFDRLEAGFPMGEVFQWVKATFAHLIGIDWYAVFDAYAGIETLDTSTLD